MTDERLNQLLDTPLRELPKDVPELVLHVIAIEAKLLLLRCEISELNRQLSETNKGCSI